MNLRTPQDNLSMTDRDDKLSSIFNCDNCISIHSLQNSPSTNEPVLTRPRGLKVLLPPEFEPKPYTVVIGRGKEYIESTGNKRLRVLASTFLDTYDNCKTKIEKTEVVSKLVDIVQQGSPKGAFVKRINGRWWEVDNQMAREKIGYVLRDLLHDKYRSSSKAKVARRQVQRQQQLRGSAGSDHPRGKKMEILQTPCEVELEIKPSKRIHCNPTNEPRPELNRSHQNVVRVPTNSSPRIGACSIYKTSCNTIFPTQGKRFMDHMTWNVNKDTPMKIDAINVIPIPPLLLPSAQQPRRVSLEEVMDRMLPRPCTSYDQTTHAEEEDFPDDLSEIFSQP